MLVLGMMREHSVSHMMCGDTDLGPWSLSSPGSILPCLQGHHGEQGLLTYDLKEKLTSLHVVAGSPWSPVLGWRCNCSAGPNPTPLYRLG